MIQDLKTNCRASKLEYAKLKMCSSRNKMFDRNPVVIKNGLSDKELVRCLVVKAKNQDQIVFDSDVTAIAQLYKRSKSDIKKFVDRANAIIKDSKSKTNVWRCQEGVRRKVEFINANGRAEVINQFGNVYLSSFIEYDK